MHITLTGANGFLGAALLQGLSDAGHTLQVAGRRPPQIATPCGFSRWTAGEPFPATALADAAAVIHLAGEPVAQRWTKQAKEKILQSRVAGTTALVDAIRRSATPPSVLISASAIGYYGDRGEEHVTEASGPGTGFLAEVCSAWEASARRAEEFQVRVVRLRFGVVLGRGGGALAKMLLPFRLGLGGRIGDGRQWMSWIHLSDVVGLILHALKSPALAGAVNATAPVPVRNSLFTRALGSALHRPTFLPVPTPALRLLYGEMSEMLTTGQYVEPTAALRSGFQFQFQDVQAALQSIVSA